MAGRAGPGRPRVVGVDRTATARRRVGTVTGWACTAGDARPGDYRPPPAGDIMRGVWPLNPEADPPPLAGDGTDRCTWTLDSVDGPHRCLYVPHRGALDGHLVDLPGSGRWQVSHARTTVLRGPITSNTFDPPRPRTPAE